MKSVKCPSDTEEMLSAECKMILWKLLPQKITVTKGFVFDIQMINERNLQQMNIAVLKKLFNLMSQDLGKGLVSMKMAD